MTKGTDLSDFTVLAKVWRDWASVDERNATLWTYVDIQHSEKAWKNSLRLSHESAITVNYRALYGELADFVPVMKELHRWKYASLDTPYDDSLKRIGPSGCIGAYSGVSEDQHAYADRTASAAGTSHWSPNRRLEVVDHRDRQTHLAHTRQRYRPDICLFE